MPGRPRALTTPVTPAGVLQVVEAAVHGDLLDDADSLAAGLERAGWRRDARGGSWTLADDPAWTLVSSADPTGSSIFATGGEALVADAADKIADHLAGGAVAGLTPGEPDPAWRTWDAAAVDVQLDSTPSGAVDLGRKVVEIPCVLQLAVGRLDAPGGWLPPDPERARRVAREGSPVQRWYLAAQEDLPDDVVLTLGTDEDPAVVAALRAGAEQRDRWRERVEAGIEGP